MRTGRCSRCGKTRMVNLCTKGEAAVGEFCGDCFEAVDHDEAPRNETGSSSGPNHNDPGFDNVIRAWEEDR